MKKVLIFGIHSKYLLEDMSKLNEDYQIIGYTDTDYKYVRKEFNYLPFYEINELKHVDFDYIILLSKTESDTNVKTKLCLDHGVPKEKIFPYFFWGGVRKDVPACNHIAMLSKFNRRFTGYIFGMSYTYLGLWPHLLSQPFYKLSWMSSDLHFMYKTSQFILNETYTDRKKLNYVILDLPYYIFNYDYSHNGVNFRKGMKFWDQYKDFHHISDAGVFENGVNQYRTYMDMFGSQANSGMVFSDDISLKKIIDEKNKIAIKAKLPHVWRYEHKETIVENIHIFKSLLHGLKAYNPYVKIVILIMPHAKCFSDYWPTEIEYAKNTFFNILDETKGSIDFLVWDYFDIFNSKDEFFVDFMHLNCFGAEQFSCEIEKRFQRELY